jgi:hypothetical protein
VLSCGNIQFKGTEKCVREESTLQELLKENFWVPVLDVKIKTN